MENTIKAARVGDVYWNIKDHYGKLILATSGVEVYDYALLNNSSMWCSYSPSTKLPGVEGYKFLYNVHDLVMDCIK